MRAGRGGLWVTAADGSAAWLIIEFSIFGARIDAPAWSPDGAWIAYQFGPPEDADIYVVPSGGGEPVNVSDLEGQEHSVSWAPDSSSLIFTNETEQDVRLYVALPDGSDIEPLLEEGGNGLGEWAPALPAND
jgi:TolB protein